MTAKSMRRYFEPNWSVIEFDEDCLWEKEEEWCSVGTGRR